MSSSQNPNQQPPVKKSKGRQKIKMEKIQNQTNLQVTFSKRKAGLFKKASELCTLCGAECGVFVFSPANKPYCFAHPNVEEIIERYEREQQQNNGDGDNVADNNANDNVADPIVQRREVIIGAHRTSNIRDLSSRYTRFEGMNRAEKGLEVEMEDMKKIGVAQQWFPKPVHELSYSELCFTKDSVLKFRTDFNEKVQMIIKENTIIAAATNIIPANTTFTSGGGSSNTNNNNNTTNAIHINTVVNYNNSPVSDPYRPAVPGSVDQNTTRCVSLFDQFGPRIDDNTPYVPQQITPTTYNAVPQVPQVFPSDNINLLPPFDHTDVGINDLGVGNYYGGTFELGESSNQQAAVSGHHHQATTDYAPLVGSGDAGGLYNYNNTAGLSGYDQQMIGGFAGNVDSNYNPDMGSAGNINLGGYGEQHGAHMNAGGPITNLQAAASNNQQFGLNDQLNFDPNGAGFTQQQLPNFDPNSVGTTQQLPFDPNSVGTTQQQLPFDPNANNVGYGGFDGTGGFGTAPDGM